VTDRPTRQYFQKLIARGGLSGTACADLLQLLAQDPVER
jgi:hypothetical protein